MPLENLKARAILKLRHERPYDYDEARGVWLYRRVDEDDEYHNIVTNAGRVAIHTYVYGTVDQRVAGSLGSGLNYIALSNDAALPVAGDTELAGELVADGLERTQGTVTLPTGSGTITQVRNQFTYVGADPQSVQKAALFDQAVGGNMAHELVFIPRVLSANDSMTLVFSITLS